MAYVRREINAYSPQYNMTAAEKNGDSTLLRCSSINVAIQYDAGEKNETIYTLVVLNIETGLG